MTARDRVARSRCSICRKSRSHLVVDDSGWCTWCRKELAALNSRENSTPEAIQERHKTFERSRAEKVIKNVTAKYGLTPDDYWRMSDAQDGKCAICLTRWRTRPLYIDHDHDTGQVRELLCGRCNTALGQLADDPGSTQRATDYLLRHGRTAGKRTRGLETWHSHEDGVA